MRRIGFVILISALVFAVGCGGSSSTPSTPTTPTTPATNTPVAECIQFLDNSFFFGSVRLADVKIGGTTLGGSAVNVAPLAVNAGPVPSNPQTNVAYTTVQVCTPGSTTSCVTIPNVAVDTGSSGLRIPASLLSTLNLPNVTLSTSTPATGGSTSSSELASSVPIHVMGDTSIPTGSSIPTTCSQVPTGTGSTTTGTEEDSVAALGANGLLGVGNYQYDCDFVGNLNPCTSSTTLPPGTYYTCTSTSCTASAVPAAQQVRNPVSLFTDNNGVILELQAVTTGVGAATASGSMFFGIGTQTNNGLSSSAVVLPLDPSINDPAWGGFTTVFNNVSYPNSTENNLLLANSGNTIGTVGSFLDSGSNGIFFLDQPTSGIADCSSSSGEKFFYCPGSTQSFPSVTNKAFNGNVSPAPFSVTSAITLFSGSNTAFSDLAGPNTPQNPGNPSSLQQAADGYFDWGLPFFYGRNVYTAIQGVTPPSTPASGVAVPAGPWWAY